MGVQKWLKIGFLGLSLCIWLLAGNSTYLAEAQEEQPLARLFITGSDIASPPTIELHVYGLGEDGSALDLNNESLEVQHNGTLMTPVELASSYEAGTFTVFLIDIPTGVADQFDLLQEAILAYTSSRHMMEQVDAVAIYKVGETTATELLAPTRFHNSVRNFFTEPLTPETGATALVDSIGNLIGQIDSLKPNPDMALSLVVISDGTDAVSTQFAPEDLAGQAVAAGVPIHTIWLLNKDLSDFSQTAGRDYLAQLSASAWGVTSPLTDSGQVTTMWERITTFRNQSRLRYTVADLTGGDFTVTFNLASREATRAQTTISIPATLPRILIEVPSESRSILWPDLTQPIPLNFPTSLAWLDGETRTVTAAQLQVNGAVVQDVPPEDLNAFDATVSNFIYGSNVVEVVILDEQGIRVTSPPLVLDVQEGRENIPDALQGRGGLNVGRLFLYLMVILLLIGGAFWAWQQGLLSRLPALLPRGPSRPRPEPAIYTDPDVPSYHTGATPRAIAYLEVLETSSPSEAEFLLRSNEVRIGRSPSAADITFEEDLTVSRLHATLMLEGNRYRLYDAQSTSGTWVNDQQVPEYGIQLLDGDEIFIGAVHLRYRQP